MNAFKLPHGKQKGLEKRLQNRKDMGLINGNATATHCKHGHEFNDTNTKWSRRKNGKWRRSCKTCTNLRAMKYKGLKTYSFAGLTSKAKACAAFEYWRTNSAINKELTFEQAYFACEIVFENRKYTFNGVKL